MLTDNLKAKEWKKELNSEMNKEYFRELATFLEEEYTVSEISPTKDNVFKALNLTDLDDVKVVILGQDPYPTKGVATGLSFAVQKDTKTPQSLTNIFNEIKSDYGVAKSDKTLENLAKQGVLLLNTVLTIDITKGTNSHKNMGWETFTKEVIAKCNEHNSPKVFLLWGNYAKKYKSIITNENHLVLETSHPTNMSYNKGFKGCNHFKLTNEFLEKNKITQIDW